MGTTVVVVEWVEEELDESWAKATPVIIAKAATPLSKIQVMSWFPYRSCWDVSVVVVGPVVSMWVWALNAPLPLV